MDRLGDLVANACCRLRAARGDVKSKLAAQHAHRTEPTAVVMSSAVVNAIDIKASHVLRHYAQRSRWLPSRVTCILRQVVTC